jgi:hypothetical protein
MELHRRSIIIRRKNNNNHNNNNNMWKRNVLCWLLVHVLCGANEAETTAMCRCADANESDTGSGGAYLGSDGVWVLPWSDPACHNTQSTFLERYRDLFHNRQRRLMGRGGSTTQSAEEESTAHEPLRKRHTITNRRHRKIQSQVQFRIS